MTHPDGSKTCEACAATCATCYGPYADQCLSCALPLVLDKHKCINHCSDGTYKTDAGCMPCPSNCATCTSSSNCDSCPPGRYLYETTTSTTCVKNCPAGYYANPETQSCDMCGDNCQTCINADGCTSCLTGLVLQANGACVV